ncbi:hypothetical protein P3T76_008967 [Phytophthora citrophthora]|uniref:Uncharacterized protein n=1 Tax=Phytophthora citrophthora TaxID=4793 RepID=A0AAD9GI57_9STRA|nr:hypothetical protein P3T76_008967 [Phytophthora citrophthora]
MMKTDSALANCSQRLTIHQGYRKCANAVLEPMLKVFLKMLENNNCLEYLYVYILHNDDNTI